MSSLTKEEQDLKNETERSKFKEISDAVKGKKTSKPGLLNNVWSETVLEEACTPCYGKIADSLLMQFYLGSYGLYISEDDSFLDMIPYLILNMSAEETKAEKKKMTHLFEPYLSDKIPPGVLEKANTGREMLFKDDTDLKDTVSTGFVRGINSIVLEKEGIKLAEGEKKTIDVEGDTDRLTKTMGCLATMILRLAFKDTDNVQKVLNTFQDKISALIGFQTGSIEVASKGALTRWKAKLEGDRPRLIRLFGPIVKTVCDKSHILQPVMNYIIGIHMGYNGLSLIHMLVTVAVTFYDGDLEKTLACAYSESTQTSLEKVLDVHNKHGSLTGNWVYCRVFGDYHTDLAIKENLNLGFFYACMMASMDVHKSVKSQKAFDNMPNSDKTQIDEKAQAWLKKLAEKKFVTCIPQSAFFEDEKEKEKKKKEQRLKKETLIEKIHSLPQ